MRFLTYTCYSPITQQLLLPLAHLCDCTVSSGACRRTKLHRMQLCDTVVCTGTKTGTDNNNDNCNSNNHIDNYNAVLHSQQLQLLLLHSTLCDVIAAMRPHRDRSQGSLPLSLCPPLPSFFSL